MLSILALMLLPTVPRPALALMLLAAFALACADELPGDPVEQGPPGDSETGDGDGDGDDDDDGEPSHAELLAELEARGPYEVGVKQLELSYVPPGSVEERVVPVLAWYPAAADSGAPPAVYAVGGLVELPAASVGALDEPPIAPGGSFPVAVYSHGSGGEGLLAYPYAERFASHGWIVFAPSHVGNTALDSLGQSSAPFVENAVNRPSDVSAVLDEADQGFAGDEVGQASDLSRVFVFGHSFGGYTTLSIAGATLDHAALLGACADESDCAYLEQPEIVAQFADGFRDPRVDAIATQAPALIPGFVAGGIAGIAVPTMLQSGKLDLTTPDSSQAAPAWESLSHPGDIWTDLPFGAHYSFITICDDLDPELLALFEPNNVNDGCGPGFTPTREIVPVLNTYLLAFARLEVLGEERWSALVIGEPLHPEVDLVRR